MKIRTGLLLLIAGSLFTATSFTRAQAPVAGEGNQQLNTTQRLERLERILQSQGLLDMLQQLEQLQQEISRLRGSIETQNFNLEQLTRRQRDLYTDIDQRLQRLEQGTTIIDEDPSAIVEAEISGEGPPLETLTPLTSISEPAPSTGASSSPLQVEIIQTQDEPPVTSREPMPATLEQSVTATVPEDTDINPITSGQVVPADPVQLQAQYQQAFNLLRQSYYDQAIRAFQEFLAAHPNDRYSDNAQYWLAEAFYVKREFEQALVEYDKVVANFPQSQKVNDALLKRGFTLYELGRMEASKSQLQDLISRQPGSAVARLADERLKMINAATANTSPAVN